MWEENITLTRLRHILNNLFFFDYTGDKYDNGVITPRPPPIQYGTQNRRRNTVRFERNSPYSNPVTQQQQGNFQNNPPQQTGNFQNYPPRQTGNFQNYPPQQTGNFRNHPMQQTGNFQNYPPQQMENFQNYPQQQGHQPGNSRNYFHQQGQQRGNFQNYAQQRRLQPGNFQNYSQKQDSFQNYPQQPGNFQDYHQGPRQSYSPTGVREGGFQRDFEQEQRGDYGPREQRNCSRGPPPGYGRDNTGDAYGGSAQMHQGLSKVHALT